jgi:Reverse transcriptase (RNA-dependent DNA polymerase).
MSLVLHLSIASHIQFCITLLLLDVIEHVLVSKWAFPSFIVPKKDGTARFVSDFRLLNQLLADEQHHLPIIRYVLTRRSGYSYVTTIDITSQFYHFELDPVSRKYVTITTPFGKYRYSKRLPTSQLAHTHGKNIHVFLTNIKFKNT